MADPLTAGLAIGSLVGGGAAWFSQGSKDYQSPAAPTVDPTSNTPPPDPSTPASIPGQKPGQKGGQQQSFLSGAAALQGAGGSRSPGKTLLGQ